MPKKYEKMIKKLYKGIGIIAIQKSPSKTANIPLKTELIDTIISAINIVKIILKNIASDALELVKYLIRKFSIAKIDIIYRVIDLEDENSQELIEKFEEIGYLFGGIFPNYHHENALVFQFMNNIKFDYSLIHSYTPLARELRDYVYAHDNNQIDE